MKDITPITEFRNTHYFLSNMYPFRINYNNVIYSCSESAYQASKSLDTTTKLRIANLDGFKAREEGRKIEVRPDWEDIKLQVMEEILRVKFGNPAMKAKLIATRPRDIIEDNWWGDTFWGVCKGKGQNHLGKLLMKIRDESTYGGGLV